MNWKSRLECKARKGDLSLPVCNNPKSMLASLALGLVLKETPNSCGDQEDIPTDFTWKNQKIHVIELVLNKSRSFRNWEK